MVSVPPLTEFEGLQMVPIGFHQIIFLVKLQRFEWERQSVTTTITIKIIFKFGKKQGIWAPKHFKESTTFGLDSCWYKKIRRKISLLDPTHVVAKTSYLKTLTLPTDSSNCKEKTQKECISEHPESEPSSSDSSLSESGSSDASKYNKSKSKRDNRKRNHQKHKKQDSLD